MPTSTLKCKYERMESKALSPDTFKRDYLFGIDLCNAGGEKISDKAIQSRIDAAVSRLEIDLEVDITPKCRTETVDFSRDTYRNWGYLEVNRPVGKVVSLEGQLGSINQVFIPIDWVSIPVNSDETMRSRIIRVMPVGSSAQYSGLFGSGLMIQLSLMSWHTVPNFWRISYQSGFSQIPFEIMDVVSKMAAIDVMNMVQDLSLGAGVQSTGISFDGFSSNKSLTASAMFGTLSSKIEGYKKDLDYQLKLLRSHYRGVHLTVL